MNSKLKSFDPAVSIRKKSGGTLIAIRNCNDLSKKKTTSKLYTLYSLYQKIVLPLDKFKKKILPQKPMDFN